MDSRPAEAERGEIIVKRLLAERQREVHKTGIATVVQGLGERLARMFPVLVVAPTFDGRAVHGARARARKDISLGIEGLGISLQMLLDIGGRRDDLEGGTGFIHIRDERVPRERIQRIEIVARNVVEVVRRQIDHREDGKIVGVENDRARRLGGVGRIRPCHHLFRKGLDAVIEGEAHVQPVRGRKIGGGSALQIHADEVGLKQDLPVFPCEIAVVIPLHPRRTGAVIGGEADDLARERAVRIDTFIVAGIVDALDLVFGERGDHFLGRAAGDGYLGLGAVGEFLIDSLVIPAQFFCEDACGRGGVLHGARPRIDAVPGAVAREQFAVGIHDHASSCVDGDLARPLVEGAVMERILPDELDIEKSP